MTVFRAEDFRVQDGDDNLTCRILVAIDAFGGDWPAPFRGDVMETLVDALIEIRRLRAAIRECIEIARLKETARETNNAETI